MSLPAPISKYVLRIKVYDLTTIHSNTWSSINTNRKNSVTKLSPVAAGHNLSHPPIPNPLPCSFHLSFTFIMSKCSIHLLVSNGRLPTLPINLSKAVTRSCTSKTHRIDIFIHMGFISSLQYKCTTHIYIVTLKIRVMHWGLPWTCAGSERSIMGDSANFLWTKYLHVLLDDLLELWTARSHVLHHFILYMYAMMMQDLDTKQQ